MTDTLEGRPPGGGVIGTRVPKLDAPDTATGRARYGADFHLPGLLVGRILRSPHAHARIVSIDTSRAAALPGVKAVLTGRDAPQEPYGFGPYGGDNLPLKIDRVRWVGDEVAAVAAVDDDVARAALDLIEVTYDPLPAVFDPYEALEPDAPQLHDQLPGIEGNVSMRWDFDEGDLDAAVAASDVVVDNHYATPQAVGAPMEPHVTTAAFDANGHLTVWSPVHMPYMFRKQLADALGLDWRRITLERPTVGGSFGSKIDIDPHDFITVMLARVTRRPVRIAFDREEEFVAARTRQPFRFHLRTGATADGRLTFRDADIVSDNGAYNAWGSHAMLVVMNTVTSLYRVPAVRVRSRVVYTNKPYGSSIRGFGNPQATFAVESQMDELALELGTDPLALRLRNANEPGDITPQRMRITTCGLRECLETVRARSGWRERRGRQRDRNRGLGVAAYIHVGGGARIYRSDGCGAILKMDDAGQVSLITGGSELGQGSETVLAMIVADELGVPLEAVRVVNADTDVKPWDVGVHASRTTFVAGNAARLAAADARRRLLDAAAEKLGARPEELTIADGIISVREDPDRSVDYARVARGELLREGGGTITTEAFYDPPTEMQDKDFYGNISASYGFGAQVAEVEVDPDTGAVRLLDLWVAQDVGRALNPLLVEGQIEGAAVMGMALALSEELTLDDGAVVSQSLRTYGFPKMTDVVRPDITLVETGDAEGPFGAKGAGEGGIIPTAAAVANAIADAVGVRPTEFPMRPWKVHGWLGDADDADG